MAAARFRLRGVGFLISIGPPDDHPTSCFRATAAMGRDRSRSSIRNSDERALDTPAPSRYWRKVIGDFSIQEGDIT
jgi:hypothetical protein